jgi:hypothetical protein
MTLRQYLVCRECRKVAQHWHVTRCYPSERTASDWRADWLTRAQWQWTSRSVQNSVSIVRVARLTPRNRVILEKLIVAQIVKEFPVVYRTWMFITVFTKARHGSLSWAWNLVHAQAPRFFDISCNIILPSTPRSFTWSFPFRFPTWTLNARPNQFLYKN